MQGFSSVRPQNDQPHSSSVSCVNRIGFTEGGVLEPYPAIFDVLNRRVVVFFRLNECDVAIGSSERWWLHESNHSKVFDSKASQDVLGQN
jgi:hypothetical protein